MSLLNASEAAIRLNISRSTFYQRLKRKAPAYRTIKSPQPEGQRRYIEAEVQKIADGRSTTTFVRRAS